MTCIQHRHCCASPRLGPMIACEPSYESFSACLVPSGRCVCVCVCVCVCIHQSIIFYRLMRSCSRFSMIGILAYIWEQPSPAQKGGRQPIDLSDSAAGGAIRMTSKDLAFGWDSCLGTVYGAENCHRVVKSGLLQKPGRAFVGFSLDSVEGGGHCLLLNSPVWYVPSLRYTRGLGWPMHFGVEVTESSTNKQQHLSFA